MITRHLIHVSATHKKGNLSSLVIISSFLYMKKTRILPYLIIRREVGSISISNFCCGLCIGVLSLSEYNKHFHSSQLFQFLVTNQKNRQKQALYSSYHGIKATSRTALCSRHMKSCCHHQKELISTLENFRTLCLVINFHCHFQV